MRIEQKSDFLSSFFDFIIHWYFYFQVALKNPIALLIFCTIIIVGLFVGIRNLILNRKKTPWTDKQKKDSVFAIASFLIVGALFYFIN